MIEDELAFLNDALADYKAALERVLALHGPAFGRPVTCKECGKPWPCRTTQAALSPERGAR